MSLAQMKEAVVQFDESKQKDPVYPGDPSKPWCLTCGQKGGPPYVESYGDTYCASCNQKYKIIN